MREHLGSFGTLPLLYGLFYVNFEDNKKKVRKHMLIIDKQFMPFFQETLQLLPNTSPKGASFWRSLGSAF